MKEKLLSLLAILLITTTAFAEDVYYCRGGLVDVGDWAQSEKYPLTKGEDGIYSGEVNCVARTDLFEPSERGWGNRVDVFFDKNNSGSTLACATSTGRFITPGRTDWMPLGSGVSNPFQCVGGRYMVYLDEENMRVRFEAIEPAFLDEVIVYGQVKDCRWQVLGENPETGAKARLKHQGDGIYTGQITLEESTDGYSDFCIRACFAAANNEGRYSSSVPNLNLLPGVNYDCDRYYGDRNWRVPVGTYNITFDISKQTIRINTLDDPDRVVTLAYAELEVAIAEAEERFPGIDLSSVKSVLENSESTDEQLIEAYNRLPELQLAHLLALMNDASESNPVNATYLIKGADCTDSNGWGGSSMKYSNGILTTNNKDFNTHQDLTSLPNGVYRLSLKGTSRYGAGNIFYSQPTQLSPTQRNIMLYATASGVRANKPFGDIHDTQYGSLASEGASSEADFCGAGWYSPTDVKTAKLWIEQGRYADNHVYAYVSDGTMVIGLTRENHQNDDMLYADDWELTYYGDGTEALALIATDIEEANADYQLAIAQSSVKDALEEILAQAKNASNLTETYKKLVETENALRKSIIAYASYQQKIQSIKAQLASQAELTGPAALILNDYLNEENEPSELFPHGTANYILANGNLNEEELSQEEAFADELLSNALKGNIVPGTDITSLFTNADWTQKDWTGWDVKKTENNNASANSSNGPEGMKVATWYNWASGTITQTLEGMPDGIYAFTYNGFLRTGKADQVQSDDDINTFAIVGEMRTPILGIYDGALSVNDAIEGENCASDDYKTDDVRFPASANGASIAFKAGRYSQTAYGMAKDGILTIGWINDGFPNYQEGWFATGAIKVVYLGASDEAASAMVEAAQVRGENIMASPIGFREETRINLGESLESKADNYEAKCEKALNINKYCIEARESAPYYMDLENAINGFSDRAAYAWSHNGLSQDKYNDIQGEVGAVQVNIMLGTYSNNEAESLTKVYTQRALDLIPIQARGGLEGVGNWAWNEVYLLFKNENGIYEGDVSMVNASDLSATNSWWGNRGDLFFADDYNNYYVSIGSPQGYIVPSDTTTMRIQKRVDYVQSPFQLQGGKYHVMLDTENLTIKFRCTEEFWMDSLYCVGTLKDFNYTESFDAWKEKTGMYPLIHTEHGVYKGKVVVEAEDENSELGLLAIMSSYNSGKSEGRYASAAGTELKPARLYQAPRAGTTTDVENNFFRVAPGEWLVTFDMNNNTIRINTLDDPDAQEGDLIEESITWYAIGGLEGVGNWAWTEEYPLVKNKEGKYEGLVKFTDETLELTNKRWGNRSDLFFRSSLGMFYGASSDLNSDQKFITPAKTKPFTLNSQNNQDGINPFLAVAGTYKIQLDEDNLTMQCECVEEKWLDAVYVRGTLKDFRWQHAVQEDSLNVLRHVGHGVYQGVITLEEDNSVTSGKFAIKTAFDEAGSEGIYCPEKDATPIEIDGQAIPVYRWNDTGKCLLAPIGKLFVIFDMNNGWVKITDPDNPNSIEQFGLTTVPKNTAVGIYTLDGRKVYSGMSQWNTATPGVYIMVKDGETKKVLVK